MTEYTIEQLTDLKEEYADLNPNGKGVPIRYSRDGDWIKSRIAGWSETPAEIEDTAPVKERVSAVKVEAVPEVNRSLPVSKDHPQDVYKEKLYQIDEGKRFKCDITGDVVGSGTVAGVIAQKDGELHYLVVKLYHDERTLEKFDLTKHGYIL